jgi:2-polyprenyl-6-hydroxyphenyl methylase / 3-demethylubiquinone-9 3-methyltransferase
MAIDNEVYDRAGQTWWDDDNPLIMLHGGVTRGRFEYFRDLLTGPLGRDPTGLRALDIGCGGGFLAEEFARLGCRVVGVDPSEISIETARRHAAGAGLDVTYLVGAGEQLPVEDSSFDIAYCCDVLEHVSDLDSVIAETARALKPRGVYFFDTVNRTVVSKVVGIKLLQEWRLTRIFDFALHDWNMFITPTELVKVMGRHGLQKGAIVGLGPRTKLTSLLVGYLNLKRGRLSYGQMSRILQLGPTKSTSMSYMGYATKADDAS